MEWHLDHVCAAAAEGVRQHDRRLSLEQAPYGVDALQELALHTLLQEGLRDAGYGVHPEFRYPRHAGKRKRSAGDRCDIVLSPTPDDVLMDPAEHGTLFESFGMRPSETLWIEVKTAHQHALTNGVAGPGAAYASELLTLATSDVRKLAGDPAIRHGAVLVVQFCDEAATAEHDLSAWLHRCLDMGLPIGRPRREVFEIPDRLGNGVCCVSVVPTCGQTRGVAGGLTGG